MREYDEAVGRLLGYAASLGMHFESECEDKKRYARLRHRDHVATVIATHHHGQFTLVSEQRFSNIDGRDVTESLQYDEVVKSPLSPPQHPNISGMLFRETVDGVEYFDGVSLTTPLFVYDDDFTPKEFDQTVTVLGDMARERFVDKLSGVGLTYEEFSEADEGDGSPSDVSERNEL